jgi:tRNA-Thr(GGU) m(6)t(6)A37 methyltransferase TsaA
LIQLEAIATVSNHRDELHDDNWGDVVSEITLNENLSPKLLKGLDSFSHAEVIFSFDRMIVDPELPPTRHPRDNQEWPNVGRLAQRSVHHPNPIGLTVVRILSVEGRTFTVQGLDAVNGSPVLDIKPVFQEFLPKDVKQPPWVSELMEDYWNKP